MTSADPLDALSRQLRDLILKHTRPDSPLDAAYVRSEYIRLHVEIYRHTPAPEPPPALPFFIGRRSINGNPNPTWFSEEDYVRHYAELFADVMLAPSDEDRDQARERLRTWRKTAAIDPDSPHFGVVA